MISILLLSVGACVYHAKSKCLTTLLGKHS